MKFNLEEMPVIPERNGRKVLEATFDELKTAGIAFSSFGLSKDDVITFPAVEDMIVRKQSVRQNSNAMQWLVSVTRNGKPSWLSTGSLRRTAKDMATSCNFVAHMNSKDFNNDCDRLKYLAGKTIKVTEMKNMETYKFDNDGTRTSETEVRRFPVIELVNA